MCIAGYCINVGCKTHSPTVLSSDSSCCICCSSCDVSVPRNMSSAKRRLERNSPSIFTPLFSQFNLLNMLSNVAVNSFDEMVSPWLLRGYIHTCTQRVLRGYRHTCTQRVLRGYRHTCTQRVLRGYRHTCTQRVAAD